MTLSEDYDIDVELKERDGSLDSLDVSIDGMNIPLFINSLDISTESKLALLSLLKL